MASPLLAVSTLGKSWKEIKTPCHKPKDKQTRGLKKKLLIESSNSETLPLCPQPARHLHPHLLLEISHEVKRAKVSDFTLSIKASRNASMRRKNVSVKSCFPSYHARPDKPAAWQLALLCFPWFLNLGPHTPVSTQQARTTTTRKRGVSILRRLQPTCYQ